VKRVAERHGATLRLADGPGGRGLEVKVIFAPWRPATSL
jgi:nitrogen fixation/metabolism regulation signal transduction histidine kinase